MTFGLEGRCGLVMGGTSELGGACVQRLCEEGMRIAFCGGDRVRGEAIAKGSGGTFIECDPRDRGSVDDALERALAFLDGRLDLLVTHSDMSCEASIETTSDEQFRALVEANLTAMFRTARACLAPMRTAGGGSIVQVSSAAGIRAAHESAAHSVTSAGVIAVGELIAAECAPDRIRANVVCPGSGYRVPPSGTPVTGADVAAVVAWLASDASGQMTGATLRIDGAEGAAMLLDTRGP
jgi:3alpha(or 20beta)-hydroxysteroid dehydrogenase